MRRFKFYSPLVPHIVEFPSGKFAVRKWGFSSMGWGYYDSQKFKKEDYWWHATEHEEWYKVDTLEEAKLLLELISLRKQVKSNKPVRIHL